MSYDTDPSTYSPTRSIFSNPEVFYGGVATGDSGTINNAKVLMSTAPYVANFRSSVQQGIVSDNYDVRVYEIFTQPLAFGLPSIQLSIVSISKSGDSDLFWGVHQP